MSKFQKLCVALAGVWSLFLAGPFLMEGRAGSPSTRPESSAGVGVSVYYEDTQISGKAMSMVLEVRNNSSNVVKVSPQLYVSLTPRLGGGIMPNDQNSGGKSQNDGVYMVKLHCSIPVKYGEEFIAPNSTFWMAEDHSENLVVMPGKNLLSRVDFPSSLFKVGSNEVSASLVADGRVVAKSKVADLVFEHTGG
jgi:hypothetical protein